MEVSPGGGGWYTEILAPVLREHGKYVAASFDPNSTSEYVKTNSKKFADKLAARPDLYDRAQVTALQAPNALKPVPDGSVDMVVTFRNIHGWMGNDSADAMFKAMYAALKPGGILGVVEHRAKTDKPQDPKAESGYVREDYAIALIEKARLQAGRQERRQREPEGHDRPPERRLVAAADARGRRRRPRQVPRDRRKRPLHAALPQAGVSRPRIAGAALALALAAHGAPAAAVGAGRGGDAAGHELQRLVRRRAGQPREDRRSDPRGRRGHRRRAGGRREPRARSPKSPACRTSIPAAACFRAGRSSIQARACVPRPAHRSTRPRRSTVRRCTPG